MNFQTTETYKSESFKSYKLFKIKTKGMNFQTTETDKSESFKSYKLFKIKTKV